MYKMNSYIRLISRKFIMSRGKVKLSTVLVLVIETTS